MHIPYISSAIQLEKFTINNSMFNELIVPPGAGSNFISSLLIREVFLPVGTGVKNYTHNRNEYNEMRCWDNKNYNFEKFKEVKILHEKLAEYKNMILNSGVLPNELKDTYIKEYDTYFKFYNRKEKSFYSDLSYIILLCNILRNDLLETVRETGYVSDRDLYDTNEHIKIYLQNNFVIPYLSFGIEEDCQVFNITHNPITSVTLKTPDYFKSKFGYQLNFVWYDNIDMVNWCNLLNSIKAGYNFDFTSDINYESYFEPEYSHIRTESNTISIEKIYFKQDVDEIKKLFSVNPRCFKYFQKNKDSILDKFKKYHTQNLSIVKELSNSNKDISEFYKILIDNYDV